MVPKHGQKHTLWRVGSAWRTCHMAPIVLAAAAVDSRLAAIHASAAGAYRLLPHELPHSVRRRERECRSTQTCATSSGVAPSIGSIGSEVAIDGPRHDEQAWVLYAQQVGGCVAAIRS